MPIEAWHAEALAGHGNGPTPRAPCRPPAREGRATAVAESKAGPSVGRELTGYPLGGEEQGSPVGAHHCAPGGLIVVPSALIPEQQLPGSPECCPVQEGEPGEWKNGQWLNSNVNTWSYLSVPPASSGTNSCLFPWPLPAEIPLQLRPLGQAGYIPVLLDPTGDRGCSLGTGPRGWPCCCLRGLLLAGRGLFLSRAGLLSRWTPAYLQTGQMRSVKEGL